MFFIKDFNSKNIIMKKLLVAIFCFTQLITYTAKASQGSLDTISQDPVRESFLYGAVGAYNALWVPVPSCGLGYRYQYNYVGLDLSIDGDPLIFANILRLSSAILFYPKPDSSSEYYAGFSCGGLLINAIGLPTCSTAKFSSYINNFFFLPELVAGYQYKKSSGKNRFIEFDIGAPITRTHNDKYPHERYCTDSIPFIPCASIKFGFEF